MRGSTLLLCVGMMMAVSELQEPALAYLDPGTGSIVIQAVVAGVVGVLALGRLYWSRLKGLVRRNPPTERDGR
jgi:hypothetical protein